VPFHILIRAGDGRADVERALAELGATAEAAGLHKVLYVAQAMQTVVMLTGPDLPLAHALLALKGWVEPADQEEEEEEEEDPPPGAAA